MDSIPERDWKLLRDLKPVLLDRFCAEVLRKAAEIATASTGSRHDCYLKLYKFLHNEDEKLAAAFNEHSRSKAIWKLMQIHALGLLTDAEFMSFSEETRKIVLFMER
jgi:hypothetical protein